MCLAGGPSHIAVGRRRPAAQEALARLHPRLQVVEDIRYLIRGTLGGGFPILFWGGGPIGYVS